MRGSGAGNSGSSHIVFDAGFPANIKVQRDNEAAPSAKEALWLSQDHPACGDDVFEHIQCLGWAGNDPMKDASGPNYQATKNLVSGPCAAQNVSRNCRARCQSLCTRCGLCEVARMVSTANQESG